MTCALFTAQRKNPSRRRPPPAQPIIDWINTAPYLLLSRLDSPRVTAGPTHRTATDTLTHDALVRGGTRHNPSVVLPDAMKRGRPPVPDLLGAARQPSNAIDMCQCETGVLQGGTSHR